MAHDERHLRHGEDDGDRHRAPHLEGHPGIGGEHAPHHLVQHREKEENTPQRSVSLRQPSSVSLKAELKT